MTNGHYTVGYNDWWVSVSTLPFFVPQYNQPSTLKKIMEKKREIHIDIRRASTLAVKMCKKNCYTTISLTNSGSKISASFRGFRICKNTWTFFGGLGSHRPVGLKKIPTIEVFCLSPFWNLNFGTKVYFLLSFWSFWDMIQIDVGVLSLKTNIYYIGGQASMLNLDIKIKVSFKLQKDSSPQSIFLTIKN